MAKHYLIENQANHDFQSNNFYTYELVNPATMQPFYVGKGRDNRAWKHVLMRNNAKANQSNPHKAATIAQIINNGMQVIVRIISTFNTEDDAFTDERRLIELYGQRSTGSGILTNICNGGEGNTSEGIPVCQYNLFGEFVAEYKNAKEAMRLNGWSNYSTISACCSHKEASYKGFIWAYKGIPPKLRSKVRPVYQWSLGGEFINKFSSQSEAAQVCKCDASTINDCLKGYVRQAVGFMWTYLNVSPGSVRPTIEVRKPVVHLNTSQTFVSVTSAAKATGHNIGAVSACCSGKRLDVGGDRFAYLT
jgi:hypothetical protein